MNKSWYLIAYNTDGRFLWKYKLDKCPLESNDGIPITRDGNVHPVTQHKDYSYVYSITPSGKLKWRFKIPRVIYSMAMVGDRDSYLYFSTTKQLSEKEALLGLYRISPDGKYDVLSEFKYPSDFGFVGFTYIASNEIIHSIFYNLGTYLLCTFGNNPFAFLENPVFIAIVVVIIATPVIYFTVKKHRMKEVQEK